MSVVNVCDNCGKRWEIPYCRDCKRLTDRKVEIEADSLSSRMDTNGGASAAAGGIGRHICDECGKRWEIPYCRDCKRLTDRTVGMAKRARTAGTPTSPTSTVPKANSGSPGSATLSRQSLLSCVSGVVSYAWSIGSVLRLQRCWNHYFRRSSRYFHDLNPWVGQEWEGSETWDLWELLDEVFRRTMTKAPVFVVEQATTAIIVIATTGKFLIQSPLPSTKYVAVSRYRL